MSDVRTSLISMGYREEMAGHWLKPVGYHLFTYHEGNREWANWFRAADESGLLLWERHICSEKSSTERMLELLKYFEAYSNISSGSPKSQFHLSAIDI